MLDELKQLQATKGKYNNFHVFTDACVSNPKFKHDIQILYKYYFKKDASNGCNNCLFDAYIQLMCLTETKAMEKENIHFEVRNGTLLTDAINKDISKVLTAANITDELALYHLSTNYDHAIKFFTKMPDNVDELIDIYKNGDAKEPISPNVEPVKSKSKTEKAENNKQSGQEDAETKFIEGAIMFLKKGSDIEYIRQEALGLQMIGSEKTTPEKVNELLNRAIELFNKEQKGC